MRNLKHRRLRKQFCSSTGKRKYKTREDAAHDMGLLARTALSTGLNAYRCRECSEFHVGHTTRLVRARFGL